MSTIIIAALVVLAPLFLILLFRLAERRKKYKTTKKYAQLLSELGSKHGLSFSGQEFLERLAIALDGRSGKMLVLDLKGKGGVQSQVIDLDEVKNCRLKVDYGDVNFRQQKAALRPEKISLCLELGHSKKVEEIEFYNSMQDGYDAMEPLNKKARHWEMMLSPLVGGPGAIVARIA